MWTVIQLMNIFDVIYRHRFYLQLCCKVVGFYLILYIIGFARYEFSLVSLNNKISNLIIVSKGKNSELALAHIAVLQKITIPTEPRIYDFISILKSINQNYDGISLSASEELNWLRTIMLNSSKTHN